MFPFKPTLRQIAKFGGLATLVGLSGIVYTVSQGLKHNYTSRISHKLSSMTDKELFTLESRGCSLPPEITNATNGHLMRRIPVIGPDGYVVDWCFYRIDPTNCAFTSASIVEFFKSCGAKSIPTTNIQTAIQAIQTHDDALISITLMFAHNGWLTRENMSGHSFSILKNGTECIVYQSSQNQNRLKDRTPETLTLIEFEQFLQKINESVINRKIVPSLATDYDKINCSFGKANELTFTCNIVPISKTSKLFSYLASYF